MKRRINIPFVATIMFVTLGGYLAVTGHGDPTEQIPIDGIAFKEATDGAVQNSIIDNPTLTFAILSSDTDRTVTATVNTNPNATATVPADETTGEIELQGLLKGQKYDIVLSVDGKSSLPFRITYDVTGPKITAVTPFWSGPNGELILRIKFDEQVKQEDTATALKDNFIVNRESAPQTFDTSVAIINASQNTSLDQIDLNLGKLIRANYQVTVSNIVDTFGNGLQLPASRVFAVFEAPAAAAPKIAITSEVLKTDQDIALTKSPTITVSVTGVPNREGQLNYFVNGIKQPGAETKDINQPITQQLRLTEQGINTVSVSLTDTATRSTLSSDQLRIALDDVGPMLQHVELVAAPTSTGTESTLLATFADSDFGPLNPQFFAVKRKGVDQTFTTENFAPGSAVQEGRTIRLSNFPTALPAGEYQITVIGAGANPLLDKAGNRAGANGSANTTGKNQTSIFSVLGQRQYGRQVEFTPYAPPKKQPIPEEGFNPGDYVETRVARLYYFRDGHRVAQIINRNIRSFNESAVTLAERRAEDSRDSADNATDERREKERAAVRAAEQARNAEQQLAQAQQALAEGQDLNRDTASYQSELSALPPEDQQTDEQKKRKRDLDQRVEKNKADIAYLGDPEELAKQVTAMQQSVANLRQTELQQQEAWQGAQAKEARARAKQFRDEVTAAETDPDTYVAGDMSSMDPVTQCSLSVIGEGLIQIRGPIKGINKIRTMINQIDSPVGQIKIGIFSVQVNGEKGDKMEKVVGDAEGSIDLSRFLVNQSLNLVRRAIQTEAALIAEQCDLNGHYQVDRDRRYLYAFFGRDFIDELYEMNSEFLFTENKLLSLHSMDTLSFNRAMFMLALAKNDVRERIVDRFLESAKSELPDAEFDFRRSSELKPHRTQKRFPPWNLTHLPITNHYHKEEVIHEAVHRNALQRYHFRNFAGFFNTGFTSPDTMNPMQREFIRLAQIFKARLVAEMEWKQRVMERGLIEDRSNDEDALYNVLAGVRDKAYQNLREAYDGMLESTKTLQNAAEQLEQIKAELNIIPPVSQIKSAAVALNRIEDAIGTAEDAVNVAEVQRLSQAFFADPSVVRVKTWFQTLAQSDWLSSSHKATINKVINETYTGDVPLTTNWINSTDALAAQKQNWKNIQESSFPTFQSLVLKNDTTITDLDDAYKRLNDDLGKVQDTTSGQNIQQIADKLYQDTTSFLNQRAAVAYVKDFLTETRAPLDHRKLLNLLIDEQEDKFIELVEGTRSHIAVMDQYLKRLSIALEDDFKIQFYDPAFVRVRDAARGEPVNLSQVERTTILTNNRDFAKVDPQATMEFDLPKRQIAIKEAFDAAKALVEDSGALMKDPTFLSAFQMMGGSTQPSTVKNLVPGQSMSSDQQTMGLVPPPPADAGSPGSALQSLVPEPAIYKLETGTGFQIRPVMQPDGDSAVYDFDYMYTTNIREPVRADEKHVGRIKRHFVHTAVQTGNFELREISRYQVALKVSRTGQGVPLLQDIPVMGALFRPAPSAESSLQQNIIFGQTNLYPTLFDLMGLRWAQQVVDLNHTSVLETEHVIRGRQKSMRDFVFGVASRRVDTFLDVKGKTPDAFRPDFYHEQSLASPYHPNGYRYPMPVPDPTGNDFEQMDRRPPEMQEPPYDRYRHQPVHPERIGPHSSPQRVQPLDVPMNHTFGESKLNSQPVHTNLRPEFESLLLQGPNKSIDNALRSRLNEDAPAPAERIGRTLNLRDETTLRPITVQPADESGTKIPPPSLLHLKPTPLGTNRAPAPLKQSTVIPASFEKAERTSAKTQIQRLPAVR